jgi:hypothetical protein
MTTSGNINTQEINHSTTKNRTKITETLLLGRLDP